jgi:hypothetical protein
MGYGMVFFYEALHTGIGTYEYKKLNGIADNGSNYEAGDKGLYSTNIRVGNYVYILFKRYRRRPILFARPSKNAGRFFLPA